MSIGALTWAGVSPAHRTKPGINPEVAVKQRQGPKSGWILVLRDYVERPALCSCAGARRRHDPTCTTTKNFFFCVEILEPWTNSITHGLRLSCSAHTPLLLHIHFPLRTTSNPSTSISHFTSRSPNEPSRVFTFNFVLARPRRPTLSLFTSPTRHLRPPGKRPKFTSNIRFLACFHIPFLKKCQFSRFTFRAKVRRGGPCCRGSNKKIHAHTVINDASDISYRN